MNTAEEKINAATQEIASIHGIAVTREDPVMILHTLNERLINDSKSAQIDLLNNFKSEMETISDQWSIEARNHSDRILSSSIVSSKTEVARVMEEQSTIIIEKWKNELNTAASEVNETLQSARQAAILNVCASFITLAASGIVFYVFLEM